MLQDVVESVEPMSDRPSWREWAQETIQSYRTHCGSLVGERLDHRGWPLDVTLAFMKAEVIRPEVGEVQKRLYG